MKKISEEKQKMMKERIIRENERKENIKKDMLETTSYIEWLIHFTEKNPIFSDDDWLYNEDGIQKEDLERVKNLPLLFECISSFAERNYISSNEDEWGESYSINKDDVYMNIGYNRGQGTSFYCERTERQDNSISYYSIMNRQLLMRTMYVDQKLEGVSSELKDLMVNLRVPVEFIREMVENTQREIDCEKKLIKKN